MTNSNTTHTTPFDVKYDMLEKAGKVIAFNPEWSNGTGYFNNAVEGSASVQLAPGDQCISISINDRKMIFTGTRLGTCVAFQRYSGSSDVITSNQSHRLTKADIFTDGTLHVSTQEKVVGGVYDFMPNIGAWLENMYDLLRCSSIQNNLPDPVFGKVSEAEFCKDALASKTTS